MTLPDSSSWELPVGLTFDGPRNPPYAVIDSDAILRPVRWIGTPDGIFVGLSFALDAVQKNAGSPIEDCRDDLADMAKKLTIEQVEEPLRFCPGLELTWKDYVRIESSLDAILSRADWPPSISLIAGHVWLGMLNRLMVQMHGRPEAETCVESYADQTALDGYNRAFAIAEKSVAHPTLKRMLLGAFLDFRTVSDRKRPAGWMSLRVVFANLRHALRIGRMRLEPLKAPVPLKGFDPAPDLFADDASQEILRRYFRHALFRKDLILRTDLFRGYGYLVMLYGLMTWYGEALRRSDTDPVEAVALVENRYSAQSGFDLGLLYHPALTQALERLFARPNFAHVMAGD